MIIVWRDTMENNNNYELINSYKHTTDNPDYVIKSI